MGRPTIWEGAATLPSWGPVQCADADGVGGYDSAYTYSWASGNWPRNEIWATRRTCTDSTADATNAAPWQRSSDAAIPCCEAYTSSRYVGRDSASRCRASNPSGGPD